MMRNRDRMAVAVRRPTQEIALRNFVRLPLSSRYPFLRWPLLRGVAALIDSLIICVESITISANEALGEEEELSGGMLFVTVALAIALGVVLFIIIPTLLTTPLKEVGLTELQLNLAEGLIRIVVFLGYLGAISVWGDIKRVFSYHGAEHKAVFCYEAGLPLTVANARRFITLHPRCGTNFLFQVILISIILFSLFGWPNLLMRVIMRLLLLPLVAGIAYELIQLAGRNRLFKFFSLPGLWLQKLTTRQPDDQQLEVALCALQAVLEKGEGGDSSHVR